MVEKIIVKDNVELVQVLEFIQSQKNGLTAKEIQAYIWVHVIGKSEESFNEKENSKRLSRNVWMKQLYGTSKVPGLLKAYCKKVDTVWVMDKMPELVRLTEVPMDEVFGTETKEVKEPIEEKEEESEDDLVLIIDAKMVAPTPESHPKGQYIGFI